MTKAPDTKHIKQLYNEVMAVMTKIVHRSLTSSEYGSNIKHDPKKDTDLGEEWESMDMPAKLGLK